MRRHRSKGGPGGLPPIRRLSFRRPVISPPRWPLLSAESKIEIVMSMYHSHQYFHTVISPLVISPPKKNVSINFVVPGCLLVIIVIGFEVMPIRNNKYQVLSKYYKLFIKCYKKFIYQDNCTKLGTHGLRHCRCSDFLTNGFYELKYLFYAIIKV